MYRFVRVALFGLLSTALTLSACSPEPSETCGDGIKQGGEACDDGNSTDGDGCQADCSLPTSGAVCGNGTIESGELCDDGNTVDGDGCEANCSITGVGGGGGGGDGGQGGGGGGTPSVCGDGARTGGELCDDGNQVDTDACKNNCTFPPPGPYCGDGAMNGSEACDDGNAAAADGCESDCTATVVATSSSTCGDGTRQGAESCDDGNLTAADGCEPDCTTTAPLEISCPAAAIPTPASGSCEVTVGDASKLFVGTVLLPGKVMKGGQVLVGTDGNIACVSCDCSANAAYAAATKVVCGQNVISPGLINSHDHITFLAPPWAWSGADAEGRYADGGIPERYEHRHDWRVGGASHNSHFSIPNGTGTGNISWSELRQVMSGTTSVAGSGGSNGLLRNLDKVDTSATAANQQGLGANALGALYETFPLRDTSGTELTDGCAYPTVPASTVGPATAAYLPHISEGIERSARNEFLCLSGLQAGGNNVFTPRTAMIHGIALKPADVRFVANNASSLIWSPRSNIALYGETAQVTVYGKTKTPIALGTDWLRSGSMNLLRELQCADYLNSSFYADYFSDETLWRMVTVNAARALVVSSRAGDLAVGKVGDIAIFKYVSGNPYRTVVTAKTEDVVLTMRAGKALYGDDALVNALGQGCDVVSVCGVSKRACIQSELNQSFSQLQGTNSNAYPLFFCNSLPQNEPTCTPMRGAQWLFSGANAYSGVISAAADSDGDGIADATDNCVNVFNPRRPEDNGVQGDADGDGKGDVCDLCPLDANVTTCSAYSATDVDADGIPNASDKCVADPDPAQVDTDGDGKGDVCDPCPAQPNAGTLACPPPPGQPVTIYDIKNPALSTAVPVGTNVQLTNVIVTGTGTAGIFVQVHENDGTYTGRDFSGLFIYYPKPAAAPSPRTDVLVGDRITIPSGIVQNYFGQVQLSNVQFGSPSILSRGSALPAATIVTADEVLTGGARAAALEGVFVRLNNVTVASITPAVGAGDTAPTNEFTVKQGAGTAELRVDDYLHLISPFPTVNETMGFVQGLLNFRSGDSKLEPRSDADIQRPVALTSIGPAGQFTRAGATVGGPTFPQAIKVKINSAQPTDTVITLTSDASVLVPAVVTISAGQTEAVVNVQGLTQAAAATITATLNAVSFNTTVRVIGASETPVVASLSPNPINLPEDGTASVAVTLDFPPATDTAVTLSVSPSTGFATAPATVTVAANTLSASFSLVAAPSATGSGSVTATLGASMVTAPIVLTNLPTTTHVVISEVQVQGAQASGTASDEFIELYNPTSLAVDMSGWRVQYKSATGAAYSVAATLPAGATIAPRGYYLVVSGGTGGYSGSVAADFTKTAALGLAGAAGHVRIGPSNLSNSPVDVAAVDTVGYGTAADSPEGGAGNVAPVQAPGQSIERKATANSTAASMEAGGADVMSGNGQDSDNNAADFIVRTAPNPQNKASGSEP